MMARAVLLAAGFTACFILCAQSASAQTPLQIDYFQGPIVSSSRVIGMGGAFVGIAEGADGHLANPASLTVRYPYVLDNWFDWDYALSFRNDSVQQGSADLDRSGRSGTYDRSSFSQLGFNLKFGRFGVGLHVQGQSYQLDSQTGEVLRTYTYEQRLGGLGVAWAFLEGDLHIGAFAITAESSIAEAKAGTVGLKGQSILIGGLYSPANAPFRLGASFRGNALGTIERQMIINSSGFVEDTRIGIVRVPDGFAVPWELNLGASWMFGSRRYNPRPTFGDWEELGQTRPARRLQRRYLLASVSLVLTGPSPDAVGVQAWLANEIQQSGKSASLSPRFGVESEVWSDFLVVRGGTYYEPSRFQETWGRVHATGGADVYLFEFLWAWKGTFVLDVAESYSNLGIGVGFWH